MTYPTTYGQQGASTHMPLIPHIPGLIKFQEFLLQLDSYVQTFSTRETNTVTILNKHNQISQANLLSIVFEAKHLGGSAFCYLQLGVPKQVLSYVLGLLLEINPFMSHTV